MKNTLDGKGAVVTGGGNDLGRAICVKLARHGASVAIADQNLRDAEETARLIRKSNGEAKAYRIDVSEKKNVDRVFSEIFRDFRRLDVLVNHASICFLTPFEKISEKEWDQIFNINLKGTFFCSQAAFRIMKSQESGRIINIASSSSRLGGMVSPELYIPHAHYAASKAAIECLTRSMAFEGAPYGILVNTVSPGPTEPDLRMGIYPTRKKKDLSAAIPLGRLSQPEEIASAIVFLASDSASYITAKVLDVNGGVLMD
jgi:3-oxoacyl-[acyl-carrier protein] reductase